MSKVPNELQNKKKKNIWEKEWTDASSINYLPLSCFLMKNLVMHENAFGGFPSGSEVKNPLDMQEINAITNVQQIKW